MYLEEKINFKGLLLTVLLPVLAGTSFYLKRSINSGEWDLKKQNAIYEEYNKFEKENKPDIKNYFKLASQAIELTKQKKYYLSIAEIRGKIKKTDLNNPLFINDFQKYMEQHKNQ
jgi:tRNA(Ile)-lysidine synthase TilS/MesJ